VLGSELAKGTSVFLRKDFDEATTILRPRFKYIASARASRVERMLFEEATQYGFVARALVP
jgi:hypothetical protein